MFLNVNFDVILDGVRDVMYVFGVYILLLCKICISRSSWFFYFKYNLLCKVWMLFFGVFFVLNFEWGNVYVYRVGREVWVGI